MQTIQPGWRRTLPKFIIHPRFLLFASLIVPLTGTLAPNTFAFETRSIDGTNNNLQNPDWGSVDVELLRQVNSDYENGSWTPWGYNRPNVREISNAVAAQDRLIYNEKHATDMLWQWGQFIDHDIDLTQGADPAEPFTIEIPAGDPYFDPQSTGTQEMFLNRSVYDGATGTTPANPRQQLNQITAYSIY